MALCSYAACSPARAATRTPKRAPSPKQSVNYPSARRRVRCANGVLGRLIHLSAGNRVEFSLEGGDTQHPLPVIDRACSVVASGTLSQASTLAKRTEGYIPTAKCRCRRCDGPIIGA